MNIVRYLVIIAAASWSITAFAALSAGDQYNLNQLLSGSPVSIRAAAEDIYRQGGAAPLVLDTLAEILLENAGERSRTYIDALSWDCNALGASGDGRYYDAVHQVAQNRSNERKLRKYCARAASRLGGPQGTQYQKGMVSLNKARVAANAPAAKATAHEAPAKPSNGHYKPITVVRAGMSMQEVEALCGPPTSSHSYQTGKAWIPFHFKGNDNYRTEYHYKGQGSIVFSNTSAYTSGMRVKTVHINPSDPGYQ